LVSIQPPPQRPKRPVNPRLDCASWHRQELCDLVDGQVDKEAQRQHLPVVLLQASDLPPQESLVIAFFRPWIWIGGAAIHLGPQENQPVADAQQVLAAIHQNAPNPWGKHVRAPSKAGEASVRSQRGVLDDIPRVVLVSHNHLSQPEQLGLFLPEQGKERFVGSAHVIPLWRGAGSTLT
jgi:hypothetical protein